MIVPEPKVIGPITRTDIVRYQGASGDMNPIHHDEIFARNAGFSAPVSVGMLQAGYLATYATDWLGARNVRSFNIRFRAPVWPGDVLTLSGKVIGETTAADGEPRVEVELQCARQDGTIAITVAASFAVDGAN
jgi:acyl dehydratase